MKTSLNNTRAIERHLLGRADAQTAALFEVRLMLDADLQEQLKWQQKTYTLIRHHGRKALRMDIERVSQNLFRNKEHASFRKTIAAIFGR